MVGEPNGKYSVRGVYVDARDSGVQLLRCLGLRPESFFFFPRNPRACPCPVCFGMTCARAKKSSRARACPCPVWGWKNKISVCACVRVQFLPFEIRKNKKEKSARALSMSTLCSLCRFLSCRKKNVAFNYVKFAAVRPCPSPCVVCARALSISVLP